MSQLHDIHYIRRFYRSYLARYKLAVWLKILYLDLRSFFISLRNIFIWQVICVRNAMIWHSRNFARRKLELASYGLTQRRNAVIRHSGNIFFWLGGAVANRLYLGCQRLLGNNVNVYLMTGFSEYSGASDTNRQELVPRRELPLKMPDVYPEEFRKFFYDGSWSLRVPAIYAFEVSKAQVMGKSDLLFLKDQCLHHELYRFDQDLMFEEVHDIVSIFAANQTLVRFKGQQVGSIPSGISLVGSATANYVHWLTETLPKLALIDGVEAYRDLPYIIDAELHPNILMSLHHLNSNGRNVIQLGRGEMLAVEKLVAISPVAYVPFDFKPSIKPNELDINPGSTLYSPDGLQQVRQSMVTFLGETEGAPKRRLFLRRTGKSRPMNNSIEVEVILREHGFEVIEPETLSFTDQVRLFSSAELIVSQGGAALGNIIFAPSGCHVIVLTTWSPYTIHYYFANLAALLGQRCTLIMCEPVQSDLGSHRAHMGVNVSISTLIKAIQQ
ncbi:glycosyltransferase family 61 protein [Zwartia vadi]|uniref:glycosyltransferase family 61 protein n=1 Tax=Zwartia vadi TaxID=3058168 RepID=UPI0025B32C02|nr:glycosyltransferase 61 family protein [Zwartia vadi]MDN3987401.1 glycosyltransferase 61 family protein [Zwartia vadi]